MGDTVKVIRTLSLAAVMVATSMAFISVSPASAKFHTELCLKDTTNLLCDQPAGLVHFQDKTAVLKTTTPALTITCEGLILGTSLGLSKLSGANILPLEVHVETAGLTYSNCDKGCTATNELPGLVLVLKTGAEAAEVTGHGFRLRLKCGVVVDCKYNWTGLVSKASGSLVVPPNGVITSVEAALTKEGGGVCPATT